ncbi:MAG: universal stress protein [Gammaproteobacteria bacterium]|nr:universal stress protein [Gammaproteobacteria bacterium]
MRLFSNILYVTESRAASGAALERAVTLAENNQASLSVVRTVERLSAGIGLPPGGPISSELQAAAERAHARELDELLAPYRKRISIRHRILSGTPFLEVIGEVLREGHDLVIKVPESPSWLDRVFGSNDMNLLRQCPCPVWLARPQRRKTYRRILVAVDVDDAYPPEELETRGALNRQAVEMACSLALSEFAELHIVHAWEAIGEGMMRGPFISAPEKKITAYINQVKRQRAASLDAILHEAFRILGDAALDYLKPHTHLVKGHASKMIPRLAGHIQADLVVMGTVARTGIPGFVMGNTAETILNQIECSVLAIKPYGFVSPAAPKN